MHLTDKLQEVGLGHEGDAAYDDERNGGAVAVEMRR
jgi:hypothetical protein